MTVAGSLTYDTKIDKDGFEKGLNSLKNTTNTIGREIKSIVAALGIDKLISASFNVINNSIDGAISRLDTLNNYPKVMSNLGIASDDAQKSINTMSNKLAGLPTTLDEAALAVQRFTSKNSDVNKSTNYFLALNNALLAGGAGADIQSTAMEQLSQAYAKGKPDMMEWRSIMTAMPAQLNQVAKAFNMTSDELGEALRNGKISMDSFMDKIVELNENGTAEFQSFEEQAKNSTGGIATSIKVAKTQVVKGVADIIKALDENLKSSGLNGISEIISNIGKKAKELLDFIAEKIPNLVDNINIIIPILGTIMAGFNLLDVNSIINLGNTVENVFGLISKKAGTVTGILSKGLGFGTLAGLALVGLGLLQDTFGEQIDNILNIAIEKGPEIITNLVNGIVSQIPHLIEEGGQLIQLLLDVITTNLPSIIEGGMKIISALIIGLAQQLPDLIPMALELILTLVMSLLDNIDLLIDAGIELIIGLAEGLINAIPILIEKIPIIIEKLINAIINNLPKILSMGIRLLIELGAGIIGAIPQLIAMIPKVIKAIINAFVSTDWGAVGKQLLQGLLNGFSNAGNIIWQAIKKVGNAMIDGIKSFFGIHSPSKVFANLGQYLPQGFAVGIDANTDEALKAIDNMNDDIISEMNKAVAFETGSINANASVKSNNSMLNVIKATFNLDGSVDIDGQRAGRILTPYMTKTLRTGGAY